jgi:hypothetical protein
MKMILSISFEIERILFDFHNSFPYHFSIIFKYSFKTMLGDIKKKKQRRRKRESIFFSPNKLRIREAKVFPKILDTSTSVTFPWFRKWKENLLNEGF